MEDMEPMEDAVETEADETPVKQDQADQQPATTSDPPQVPVRRFYANLTDL
jgi:hypothetical protein